jgi:hypothetical protein
MFSAHGDRMANLSADISEISWQDARPAGALGSLVLVIDALQGACTSPVSGSMRRASAMAYLRHPKTSPEITLFNTAIHPPRRRHSALLKSHTPRAAGQASLCPLFIASRSSAISAA